MPDMTAWPAITLARVASTMVGTEKGDHRDAVPSESDGLSSEMPHVSVNRLGSCRSQQNGSEQTEDLMPVQFHQQAEGIVGRDGKEHFRFEVNLAEPEETDCDEPCEHDRTEQSRESLRPKSLDGEQGDENRNAQREDEVPAGR